MGEDFDKYSVTGWFDILYSGRYILPHHAIFLGGMDEILNSYSAYHLLI